MDWTAVTLSKNRNGHAYFKSIPYCLKASDLVPLKDAKGIWLRETADPEALAEPAGKDWVKLKNFDVPFEGDVKHIKNWAQSYTLE